MPHLRKRYAQNPLQKALKHSSIVGLVGQRQSGKTTLLVAHASESVTMDLERNRISAEADPEHFLTQRKIPFGIDEVQTCPQLFPAMKEYVRIHPAPGRLLLSGSVRFTSRKAIRESLTGRLYTIEILPFTIAESHERKMPTPIQNILLSASPSTVLEKLQRSMTSSSNEMRRYLEAGGLPGISFFRDSSIRAAKWSSQIDTQLARDLRLITNTTLPYAALRSLLVYIAQNQGQPLELKSASEFAGISTVALKRLLPAFEGLFLIRTMRSSGPEKKSAYLLEDQGMASWLTRRGLDDSQDVFRGLYANLRQELFYKPELNGEISHYRNKNGVTVPLVFHTQIGTLGVIPSIETLPSPKLIGSAQAFLRNHPKAKLVIACGGHRFTSLSERMFVVPYWALV